MSIRLEERGPVGLVQLDRPDAANALTRAILDRLAAMFSGFSKRQDLRAVILTGAGREAFCAGLDDGATSRAEDASRVREIAELVELCGVPAIAAVNGLAAGAGLQLALACHLRVASGGARFVLPQTADEAASHVFERLARVVGPKGAQALREAGTSLTAAEALRCGLVNRVVREDVLMDEAHALAETLIQNAPLAIRAVLEAVTRGLRLPLDDGLALEAELFSSLFDTADLREGTLAFLEKRPPRFKGQ